VDVARFGVAPGIGEGAGFGDHRLGVGGDALAMKRGLHQAALAQPEIAFAGEQTVAEEFAIGLQAAALDEFLVVGDDHLLDEIGMVQQDDAIVQRLPGEDVAVRAGPAGEHGERIKAGAKGIAEWPRNLRTFRRQRQTLGHLLAADGASAPASTIVDAPGAKILDGDREREAGTQMPHASGEGSLTPACDIWRVG
jgi:hypothetical protein